MTKEEKKAVRALTKEGKPVSYVLGRLQMQAEMGEKIRPIELEVVFQLYLREKYGKGYLP